MVDSIKGGCGKTTFSIMLAQFLQRMNQDRYVEDRICLLDFDFLGTGLVSLFFGTSEKIEEKLLKKHEYITKIIRGFDTGYKKYLCDCKIDDDSFLVGFGDPDYRRKEAYYMSSQLNYTPVIHYEIFRNGICQILKSGFRDQIDKVVNSVVLDMSPGVDAYSCIVKDCLFDKTYSDFLDEEDKRYYFLMTGIDNSQLYAAANYFQEFMRDVDKCPNKLFIVLNDWVNIAAGDKSMTEKEQKELYQAWTREFECYVGDSFVGDQVKVYFLIPHYFDKYWECIHKREALINNRNKIFLEIPFRYWKEWGDEELKEVRADDCKEILN